MLLHPWPLLFCKQACEICGPCHAGPWLQGWYSPGGCVHLLRMFCYGDLFSFSMQSVSFTAGGLRRPLAIVPRTWNHKPGDYSFSIKMCSDLWTGCPECFCLTTPPAWPYLLYCWPIRWRVDRIWNRTDGYRCNRGSMNEGQHASLLCHSAG